MLAAGTLSPVVEITSTDPSLRDDPHVGVRFLGAAGDAGEPVGAVMQDGTILSNRTRLTHHPASTTAHLPMFADADPVALPADGIELDLTPDGTGYAGVIRGGLSPDAAMHETYRTIVQMIDAAPWTHRVLYQIIQASSGSPGGPLTYEQFTSSPLFIDLLAPDLSLHDASGAWAPSAGGPRDAISFAVSFHLTPCDGGACPVGLIDHCTDRKLDGDEADLDCGGSCRPCATSQNCQGPADCQSRQCQAGACAAPSCSDGVQDGFESDVDCGYQCAPCALGRACYAGSDCQSGRCNGQLGDLGQCVSM
jgi:hypothetical protein